MATGDAPAAASGDPYATSKANLRDTLKWLAGIFGALAAAVIVGAPVSGLGAIRETPAFLPSILALLLGFAFISSALIVTLRLLRSDLLYASDVDPRVNPDKRADRQEIERIRADIGAKAVDLLPAGYKDMQSFLAAIDAALTQAQSTAAKIEVLDAQQPRDDAQIALKLTQYGIEQGVVRDYRAAQQRVMAYAELPALLRPAASLDQVAAAAGHRSLGLSSCFRYRGPTTQRSQAADGRRCSNR